MAFYAWTATDVAGKTQRGTLQAEGQKQVRQMLREQKLMPVSISETREAASAGKAKTGARLSTPVLSMFTRQLSTLVNAALPLESALKAISKQTEDKKLAAMVVEIREKVVEGHTLFDAFSQFPRTFDKLYCTLVMAGEKTGHLGDVLEKLAEYNEQRQKMKSKLTQAMVYPITLTVVAIAVISILLVVIFTNLPGFFSLLGAIGKILSPLVSGIVIAFLLNPIVNFVDLRLRPILKKRGMKEGKADKLSRAVALVFAFIFAAFIVYAFFAMLLPQLYESVTSIVNSAPEYYQSLEKWAVNVLEDNPEIRTYVERALDTIQSYVENWVKTSFLSDVQKILATLTTSVMAVVKSITNFIIGLVASIYILWSKDTFQAQAKKMVVAAFKPSAANHLLDLGRNINRIFSGFIIGKIIDSAIIGVLCYICMSLMKMPYTALIATIVGVTNVIPVFGPFIGAVPSALIILLVEPLQAFYFIIFIIVLQQVDGNVIGPKILGNTVGISGFWVLISITVAAGIFGFAGMLLGVPVFAVIYLIISDIVNSSLRKKQKTTITDDYYDIHEVADLDRKAQAEEAPEETSPNNT